MKIVLSDKKLCESKFPNDVKIEYITYKELLGYDGNENVVAVAGSRAMAIKCAEMNMPSLKLFQLTSAGFDGVPLDNFAQKCVAVANAGSVYSHPA